MTGWNESYNWTKNQFTKVVNNNLTGTKRCESVCLDTEHTDAANEKQIISWAHELGYGAEILDGGDKIRVYKIKK